MDWKSFWTTAGALLAVGSATAADSGWMSAIDSASTPKVEPNVHVELIAQNKALTPQAKNTLAVVLRHEPGWHTYWRMPGEAGLPTTFTFTLPQGMKAQEPLFPLPERFLTAGLVTYGYSGETIFPFQLDVPRTTAFGSRQTIKVSLSFLACKDVCIPGEASASIRLPVVIATDPGPDAARIEAAQRLIPEVVQNEWVKATMEDDRIRFDIPAQAGKVISNLTFFPLAADAMDIKTEPVLHRTQEGATSLFLKATPEFATSPRSTIDGVLIADGGPANGGWAAEMSVPVIKGTVELFPLNAQSMAPTAAGTNGTNRVTKSVSSRPSLSTLTAVGFALLGGLILNLMPCVFPVLSLKLLQLVEGAKKGESLVAHGFVFTSGVLFTMLLLSGTLLALRAAGLALGWGFQLQSPGVIALLMLLFTGITLNLAGLFEFTVGTQLADTSIVRRNKTGLKSSFLTGMLAVIVASPCTAPFMGAALGYAVTQPAVEALAVFLALGLGMALPWLLLCLVPAWANWLPKPGPWMDTFRKIMAVPMGLALVWLGWVLSRQVSTTGLLLMTTGVAALGVALWLFGRRQWGKPTSLALVIAMSVIALGAYGVVASGSVSEMAARSSADRWEPWSDEAVEAALAQGRPVFVDFTAAWCVTCQANKIAVLNTDSVTQALQTGNFVTLEGDWTNRDERISTVLERYNRTGVPLYLVYSPTGEVTVLPELLTTDTVLEALRNASH